MGASEGTTCCSSRACKICGCCTCCFCTILITIAIALVVVAATLKKAEVSVKGAVIKKMSLTPALLPDTLTISVDIMLSINNPNNKPLEGKLQKLLARVSSIDKQASDKVGNVYYLGDAILPSPVMVAAQSETVFVLTFDAKLQGPSATPIITRMTRDCGMTLPKETRLRVNVDHAIVNVLGKDVHLDNMKVELDLDQACSLT